MSDMHDKIMNIKMPFKVLAHSAGKMRGAYEEGHRDARHAAAELAAAYQSDMLTAAEAERDAALKRVERIRERLKYIAKTWPDSFAGSSARAALAEDAKP